MIETSGSIGHVVERYGVRETPRTKFVNASICDVAYRPVNGAVVVELD